MWVESRRGAGSATDRHYVIQHLATLDYQPPERPVGTDKRWLLVGIATAVGTLLWIFMYPALISNLPRPMQGESVKVPFVACAVLYLAIPVLLPAFFVRNASSRVAFALLLFALALAWYFGLGSNELLSKAWRRGL